VAKLTFIKSVAYALLNPDKSLFFLETGAG